MSKPTPPESKIVEEELPFPLKVVIGAGAIVSVFLLGMLVHAVYITFCGGYQ